MSKNLFFELLQVALGTRDGLSRVPSAVEWGAMYDEAERQAVASLLLSGIERLPAGQHFFPIWLYNPIRNWRLQRYFKGQTAAQMVERETGFGYPSVEFNAIYSLVHTFHHLMDEGVGLRHVVDYYYVLR